MFAFPRLLAWAVESQPVGPLQPPIDLVFHSVLDKARNSKAGDAAGTSHDSFRTPAHNIASSALHPIAGRPTAID